MAGRNVIDFTTLTVGSAAVSLADAGTSIVNLPTVKHAVITVETDQVRWRADGTAPASGTGHLLEAGDILQFLGDDYRSMLLAIQFIRVTNNATLSVTYLD